MSSELSPENESFIQGKIASGFLPSRETAVEAGIEMLRKREELVSRINESRYPLDEGDFEEYDDKGLERRFDELKKRAAQHGQGDQ